MKKFNLTAKYAKKVLALALAAALIVPAIPGQVDADVEHYVDMPEAVASYPLDSADEFVAEDTVGKAIKFEGEAVKATWTSVTGDKADYSSTDKTPVKDGDAYVYEDIDVTPEIVTDDERGTVLSLKENVTVPQYPEGATHKEDIIQEEKSYYSAVEVANPFTALRSDLYDASRYTVDQIYGTATEVTRYTVDKATDRFAEYKNRYSAPVAKAGVTISMWAQLPYDEETSTAAISNFVEFYNNESVLYKTDDLAKNWIASQYEAAAEAGTANAADSPFYTGTSQKAKAVDVNAKVTESFSNITAGTEVTYIDGYGIYAKWNPAIAQYAMANNSGQLKCWVINATNTTATAGNKEIVVEAGENESGEKLYHHLKWSDTVYAEGDETSKLVRFGSTEDAPKGIETKWTQDSKGILSLASNQQWYLRDAKNGIQMNEEASNAGKTDGMQHNTYAYVTADATVSGSIMDKVANEDTDDTWHYLTYTITDEWIQTYVDGVAVDPSTVTTWYGNTFNQGSGIYKPNSTYVTGSNMRSDWQKICNDDITGSIYGQIFGESVMSFITDENTKLYIGGKDQATFAGTKIDDVTCYAVPMTELQAGYAYKLETEVALPIEYDEALSIVELGEDDDLVAEGTTGTAIQFTGEAIKATWTSVTGDKADYSSTDKTPVKDGDAYVYEDIDVTPEIVTDDERGTVLSLKENVTVPQYPEGATHKEDIIQEEKSYYSAVEVANPFTALRSDLYDASRYTVDQIYGTATEVTRYTVDKATDRFAEYKNRYSAPVAKAGVTISMWAQLPYDEETSTAAISNFVEFYNNESVLYKTDDLAKNWIASQYEAAAEAGTANAADSPFYTGTSQKAKAVDVNAKVTESFSNITAGTEVTYIDGYGIYAKWNPAIAQYAMANNSGQLKCWVINATNTTATAGNKEIVVEAGENESGEKLYHHLKWSDTVYAEGDETSKLVRFGSTEDAPKGIETKWTQDSKGILSLASNQQWYLRDAKNGIQMNEEASNAGKTDGMQHNTYAYVTADATVSGSIMDKVANEDTDDTWHYLTYTITDEWIQTYVDGVAVDPSTVTTWYGNTFNQGSGIYKPNSTYVTGSNMRSDWQKICNDDITGSIYGQIFGESVMSFITDENTKLYIGGKDQATFAGTRIDSVALYAEPFSRDQAAKEYADRTEVGHIQPAVTLGDVNGDEEVNANDALEILKYAAKMVELDSTQLAAAEVDGVAEVNANDALAVLKYAAKMIDKFPIEG